MNSDTLKKEFEETERMNNNYKIFSEFWERAIKWKDEDGDNFLKWDKAVIGQFCFIEGREQAKAETQKKNALEWRDFFKECGVMENIGVDRKKLIINKLKNTKAETMKKVFEEWLK